MDVERDWSQSSPCAFASVSQDSEAEAKAKREGKARARRISGRRAAGAAFTRAHRRAAHRDHGARHNAHSNSRERRAMGEDLLNKAAKLVPFVSTELLITEPLSPG